MTSPRELKTLAAALCVAGLLAPALSRETRADDAPAAQTLPEPDPKRGFDILMTVPMADPWLKIADLDNFWTVWEPEARAKAEKATPAERHKMTFERYGFIERTFDKTGLPLGYVDDGKGNLATNCFSCHAGKVAGQALPGLGNAHHDLTAMMTDVAKLRAKERGENPDAVADQVAIFDTPFNMKKGVSNATMFAFILGAYRDKDANIVDKPMNPTAFLKHNDLSAPAWWQYKYKDKIYCDSFGTKHPRGLMAFTMSIGITGEQIRGWEDEFVHIKAYIESCQPPKYPYEIDKKLAAQGREVFDQTCAKCHGNYGDDGRVTNYPNKVVPIKEIGTDRVRYDGITPVSRAAYNQTWFSDYGKHPMTLSTPGYIAPPLEGVWATAPYFHNGSVPTIHDVFNPAERPVVWKRSEDGYDKKKVGVEVVEALDKLPEGLNSVQERTYYDTTTPSHGAGGHLYPDELDPEEKAAVLEYLKTL